ncbi:kinesin-like protein KIF24 isoform X4 [Pungitius pungitius]|uniref:kinesin-like protein KIF24 isoform X4 n=1 Tax=Pungitius pungitius TaxID=134920 RepID=UPI002E14159E
MPLCLYECLTAVGLQSHFARFTSLGVHQAAHLSDLTVEDYPFLGIRSMEDRTRLFNLVQMLKTLNLKNEDADDDTDAEDTDHERVAAVSKLNAPNPPKPPHVRRRLDFSCETSDHRLNLFFSCPDKPVHVCASHIRNIVPCQGRASAIPVQVDTGSGCKEKNHHRLHFHRRISRKVVGQKGRNGILRRENFCSDIKNNVHTEHNTKPTPVYESKRTTGYNYGLPLTSPPVPDNKQPGGQRISVCLRKRPLTKAERRRGEADVVTTQSGECVIVDESKEAVDLSHYKLQHRFYFDQVFGEESSNVEVYQRTAYPLVQHMLNGGKATCFAYGQTGAGKTHTMLGSPVRPGLYALAVLDIFAYLSTPDMHSPLLVHVSFFEIYCGQLYDLLDHRKRLFAREDGQKVVHIVGLRDVRVDSVGSLLEVISRGTEERTQGMSGVNPVSSRSHALLQIQLRDADQHIAGRMWFVDLAGSEKASDTKEPNRQSRMEGAEINQSLLALKECIRSLDQEQSHTPFRQSKLTQVLKDSFVGDSMTCMIANISPGHLATEHTLNTLRYADRVKELGGQLGLRGRRRGKPTHSSKCNLSNSSSRTNVVGTRGKGPPKKPKSGGQTPIFGVPTPTTRLTMEGSILCSTPKGGRQEGETSPSARKSIGLEKITAVRGLLGMGDSRDRGGGRESERRESNGVTGSLDKSDKKSVMAATDEQILLKEVQKKSGFNHNKKDNHQITWKEESKEERSWMEEERRVKSSRDTSVSDLINQDMDEVLHAYRGLMEPLIPEAMLLSCQDQETNHKTQTMPAIGVLGHRPPASPLKTSTCSPTQTLAMQPISSFVRQSGNSSSPGSRDLMTYGTTRVPSEYADSVGRLNTVPKQRHTVTADHPGNSNISLQQYGPMELNGTSNQKITPIINLLKLGDLDDRRSSVVQGHWEQLEEMEALFRKDWTLMCQQPDMAFGEYAHKLVDIMERKARCAQSMITQLQPFLKPSHSN